MICNPIVVERTERHAVRRVEPVAAAAARDDLVDLQRSAVGDAAAGTERQDRRSADPIASQDLDADPSALGGLRAAFL
jgi:hypothetical protein